MDGESGAKVLTQQVLRWHHGLLIVSLILALAALAVALATRVNRQPATATLSAAVAAPDVPPNVVAQHLYPLVMQAQAAGFSDRQAFFELHGKEVKQTLEVVEVLTADSLAVALIRYSLGPKVYRDAFWLRKVGAVWRSASRQSFSPEAKDPFADDNPERARRLIAQATAWVQAGATRWW